MQSGAKVKLDLCDWMTLDQTIHELSDLSFFTFISSNLLIWVYTIANGESGTVGGTGEGLHHSTLKYLVCKSLSICSLALRFMLGFAYLCI